MDIHGILKGKRDISKFIVAGPNHGEENNEVMFICATIKTNFPPVRFVIIFQISFQMWEAKKASVKTGNMHPGSKKLTISQESKKTPSQQVLADLSSSEAQFCP